MAHDMSRPATEDEVMEIIESRAFRRWKVADYQYWALYLNAGNQQLPGRCYAWLRTRHRDRMSLTDLGPFELKELVQVLGEYEVAVKQLWPVSHVEFEWLCNETDHHRGHGHAHFTPRFSRPFTTVGREFTDVNFGARRSPEKLHLQDDELEQLRFAIKQALGK